MERLFIEVKEDDFDALERRRIANELNCSLLVWPVLARQAVKDGSCITVIF